MSGAMVARRPTGVLRWRIPNLFLLTGPNSALSHNSGVRDRTQVHYVPDALRVMTSQELAAGAVQPQAQEAFVRAVRARMSGAVWVTGDAEADFGPRWPQHHRLFLVHRSAPASDPPLRPREPRLTFPAPDQLTSCPQPPGRDPVWEHRGQPPRRPRPP